MTLPLPVLNEQRTLRYGFLLDPSNLRVVLSIRHVVINKHGTISLQYTNIMLNIHVRIKTLKNASICNKAV